jgi:hypothetical protein
MVIAKIMDFAPGYCEEPKFNRSKMFAAGDVSLVSWGSVPLASPLHAGSR